MNLLLDIAPAVIFAAIILWVLRHPTKARLERAARADAFKAVVIDVLRSIDASETQYQAINAWAWACKSGWQAVDPNQFQLLLSRMEPKP